VFLLANPACLSIAQDSAPTPIIFTKEQANAVAETWGQSPTAGLQLQFDETKRTKSKGTTLVNYRLLSKGFLPGKTYLLWMKESFATSATALFSGLIANSAGELVCAEAKVNEPQTNVRWCPNPGRPLVDQLNLGVSNYHKGEPFDLGVIATDDSVRAFAHAVPFPIEAADGACHLSVEMITPDGLTFGALLSGFEAGAELQTISISGKERLNGTATNGGAIVLLPGIAGKDAGTASLTVAGGGCRVSVNYDWGRAATKVQ
jgi:hypothetical protein